MTPGCGAQRWGNFQDRKRRGVQAGEKLRSLASRPTLSASTAGPCALGGGGALCTPKASLRKTH